MQEQPRAQARHCGVTAQHEQRRRVPRALHEIRQSVAAERPGVAERGPDSRVGRLTEAPAQGRGCSAIDGRQIGVGREVRHAAGEAATPPLSQRVHEAALLRLGPALQEPKIPQRSRRRVYAQRIGLRRKGERPRQDARARGAAVHHQSRLLTCCTISGSGGKSELPRSLSSFHRAQCA